MRPSSHSAAYKTHEWKRNTKQTVFLLMKWIRELIPLSANDAIKTLTLSHGAHRVIHLIKVLPAHHLGGRWKSERDKVSHATVDPSPMLYSKHAHHACICSYKVYVGTRREKSDVVEHEIMQYIYLCRRESDVRCAICACSTTHQRQMEWCMWTEHKFAIWRLAFSDEKALVTHRHRRCIIHHQGCHRLYVPRSPFVTFLGTLVFRAAAFNGNFT